MQSTIYLGIYICGAHSNRHLGIILSSLSVVVSDVDVEVLARGTVGFSGMDTYMRSLTYISLLACLFTRSFALGRNTHES